MKYKLSMQSLCCDLYIYYVLGYFPSKKFVNTFMLLFVIVIVIFFHCLHMQCIFVKFQMIGMCNST